MNQITDTIELMNGSNVLKLELSPNSAVIIDSPAMIHMDGKLVVEPIIMSKSNNFFSKLGSSITRSLTGERVYNSQIANKTDEKLKISIGPQICGGIIKINILPGEVWKFIPGSFIACTSNVLVSGNINIFKNLKSIFSSGTIVYTEISLINGDSGTVWINSFGGIEKHEVQLGEKSEKLYINDGCFLGMLSNKENMDYWDECIKVGSASGFFSGLFTNTAILLKVEDKKLSAKNNNMKCIVYTQSINKINFDKYITSIVIQSQHGGNNKEKYEKYEAKYNMLTKNDTTI